LLSTSTGVMAKIFLHPIYLAMNDVTSVISTTGNMTARGPQFRKLNFAQAASLEARERPNSDVVTIRVFISQCVESRVVFLTTKDGHLALSKFVNSRSVPPIRITFNVQLSLC
jgi:hypothetical protein